MIRKSWRRSRIDWIKLYRLGLSMAGLSKDARLLETCKNSYPTSNCPMSTSLRLTKYQAGLKEAQRFGNFLAKRQEVAKTVCQTCPGEDFVLRHAPCSFLVQYERVRSTPAGVIESSFWFPPIPVNRQATWPRLLRGELSRMMLAIKTVLAGTDRIGTLILRD